MYPLGGTISSFFALVDVFVDEFYIEAVRNMLKNGCAFSKMSHRRKNKAKTPPNISKK